MEVLFILLYFQLSGLLITLFNLYLDNIIYKRALGVRTRKLIYERRKNEQWLIDYFQEHPKKIFKQSFPEIFTLAIATKRYKELNTLKRTGFFTEKEYERSLKKILLLVDIRWCLKSLHVDRSNHQLN